MGPELEEAMDQFISEIEADNKELLNTVAQMKKEHDQRLAKLTGQVEELEKRVREQDSEFKRFALSKLEQQHSVAEHVPTFIAEPVKQLDSEVQEEPLDSSKGTANIRDRYDELFRLHDEGKSVEAIAKKLGMNKGEVNLILQLAKQEER